MARIETQKPNWDAGDTWNAALRLCELSSDPAHQPALLERGLTPEFIAEVRSDSETFKVVLAAGTGIDGQLAATAALTKACQEATTVVMHFRDGFRRGGASKHALTLAGIGTTVDPTRSSTVEKGLSQIISASENTDAGPELAKLGLLPRDIAKFNGFLLRIRVLDTVQEVAKGARPKKSNQLRMLHLKIQESVNTIISKANFAFAEDDDVLKLFTDCLPRTSGDSSPKEPEAPETPAEAT